MLNPMTDTGVRMEESWKAQLADEFQAPYFIELRKKVRDAYEKGAHVFPAPQNIFQAFNLCPFDAVKVVILGQDPYHGKGQAMGLSFSVPDKTVVPPSLQNIYKELHTDLGVPVPKTGDLTHWAEQGVLLLNATLTVLEGRAGSHQGLGWETFTDAVIKKVSDEKENIVFILWGRYAQSKSALIDSTKHLILKAPHPSPLSAHAGFFGSKPFSQTNDYLKAHGKTPIDW
jgi:uracil-DNA glycosylase